MRSSFWFQELSASHLSLPLEVVSSGPRLAEVANFFQSFRQSARDNHFEPDLGAARRVCLLFFAGCILHRSNNIQKWRSAEPGARFRTPRRLKDDIQHLCSETDGVECTDELWWKGFTTWANTAASSSVSLGFKQKVKLTYFQGCDSIGITQFEQLCLASHVLSVLLGTLTVFQSA